MKSLHEHFCVLVKLLFKHIVCIHMNDDVTPTKVSTSKHRYVFQVGPGGFLTSLQTSRTENQRRTKAPGKESDKTQPEQ